jgi:high-affinity Fe2+/Pb2+ permease
MAQGTAMTGIAAAALSIAVLAAFALAGGGAWLLIRRNERKQGTLMLIAAAVLFANVLVWTL